MKWLKEKIRKWLLVADLEEFAVTGFNHLVEETRKANKNVALIDGRMRELELALFLMSVEECAEYLCLSEATIKRRLTAGELIGRKVGRCWIVTKLELLRYENRVKAEHESSQ